MPFAEMKVIRALRAYDQKMTGKTMVLGLHPLNNALRCTQSYGFYEVKGICCNP
jgi:ABC-type cobalamin/Fe3+-siderophores transport system ATPase subunit